MPKILTVALGLLLALTACSPGTDASPQSTPTPSAGAASTDTSARELAVAEIRDTLPAQQPEKTVVMSVALAEIIDSLGVVPDGVPTSQSPLPASLDQVPRVGSVIAPDVEMITGMQPDLILGPTSIKDSLEKRFSPANLPTAYVPTDTLDDLIHTTLALGDLYGKTTEAEAVATEVDQARATASATKPVKVLILFGQSEEFNVLNERTFAGGIAADVGATNVATELGLEEAYSPLSLEQVIIADPDLILFLAHGDLEAAEAGMAQITEGNDAWQKLRAVQDGRVHALDHNAFFNASLLKAPAAYSEMASVLSQ